jgi:hypothetical protein
MMITDSPSPASIRTKRTRWAVLITDLLPFTGFPFACPTLKNLTNSLLHLELGTPTSVWEHPAFTPTPQRAWAPLRPEDGTRHRMTELV